MSIISQNGFPIAAQSRFTVCIFQDQATDHRVVTLCSAINQKILDTAERIIADNQRALLANSVEFVIGAVWASRPDKMTDLQKAIHKEISTTMQDQTPCHACRMGDGGSPPFAECSGSAS